MSSQNSQPEFIKRQLEFAAHIRNPDVNPAPADVDEKRMAAYRELFYNNIDDQLGNAFPVIKSILSEQHWDEIVRDFYHVHESHTPLFSEIPQEFISYLEHERNNDNDPPFLLELAHYEWVELALAILDEKPDLNKININGDLFSDIPVLSPAAWPLSYHWPVHQLSAENQPETLPEHPSLLVVYRDDQDEIHFMEINTVTARLLALIKENTEFTGKQLLAQISDEMQYPDPDSLIDAGKTILKDMQKRTILVGTLRK
ncbi:MAG: putative DNA-binding domain-containing protein [Gammaproteobacteria bacterium]|nr:putative DNA-binding domain-containing protein [Gammaproteobacteria bacterium]MDH5592779.1 putative DNA-binding domain-containing protein [Gammaproteobacteria bacterium]